MSLWHSVRLSTRVCVQALAPQEGHLFLDVGSRLRVPDHAGRAHGGRHWASSGRGGENHGPPAGNTCRFPSRAHLVRKVAQVAHVQLEDRCQMRSSS